MPRRPPGALRAQQHRSRGGLRRNTQVNGLAGSSQAAVARLEAERLWPGAVADAVSVLARFLKRPGRVLYLAWEDCPCCDVVMARDTLQTALTGLPARARVDLRVVVDKLDTEILHRTLQNPSAPVGPWWHRRLGDR